MFIKIYMNKKYKLNITFLEKKTILGKILQDNVLLTNIIKDKNIC